VATAGILRQVKPRQLILETADHRIIWYAFSDKLQGDKEGQMVELDSFAPGDHLIVSHTADEEGRYTAVAVQWQSAATPEERATATRSWDLPSAAAATEPEAEEVKRPALRRGRPAAEPKPAPAPKPIPAAEPRPATPPASTESDDPVIKKAREATAEFSGMLPSFTTKQLTTRYVQEDARKGWQALDVVTADLVYANGKEDYRNIKVGNKPTTKPMDQISGTRSTGEFGSLLDEIMDPATATVFRRLGQDTLNGRAAFKYRFEVTRERSRFRIDAPSEMYYTAYRGSIWIDKDTSRILRVEQEASGLPKLFPFDKMEVTVSYDFVRLDVSKLFLLPVESEALDCQRGSTICSKNHTEFRNYTKFDAESNILFDK